MAGAAAGRAPAPQRAAGPLRAALGRVDGLVAASSLALVAFGLVVVYSASLMTDSASVSRQAVGAGLGLALACAVCLYDYRRLSAAAWPLLLADCLLMLAPLVPGLGYDANGMTGWVKVPLTSLTFQTSELAKPVTVLLVASLAARYNGRIPRLADYLGLCGALAVPFGLILLQPDLGTGLVILVAGAAVIVVAGPRRSWVLATLGVLAAAVAVILLTDSVIDAAVGDDRSIIKDYQMNRLLVFLNPEHDTSSAGYNLQQSLIAVGSGGLTGKGLGNATQAASGFLPEAHTDFVFALLSEEFGFVGAAGLLAGYLLLIFSSLRVAMRCEGLFGKLVVVGVVACWAFQIFENVGMCLSLMPITGIPLPFVSFGSSSMIAELATVGLVQSVAVHGGGRAGAGGAAAPVRAAAAAPGAPGAGRGAVLYPPTRGSCA